MSETAAPSEAETTRKALDEMFRLFGPVEQSEMSAQAKKWERQPAAFAEDMKQWMLITLQITKKIAHGEISLPVKGWASIQYRALEALPDLIDSVLDTMAEQQKQKEKK